MNFFSSLVSLCTPRIYRSATYNANSLTKDTNDIEINYETVSKFAENASKEDVILVLSSAICALQRYSAIPKAQVLENLEKGFEEYSGWSETV
jgi:hypothetical protein